jgi:hypothetical protein
MRKNQSLSFLNNFSSGIRSVSDNSECYLSKEVTSQNPNTNPQHFYKKRKHSEDDFKIEEVKSQKQENHTNTQNKMSQKELIELNSEYLNQMKIDRKVLPSQITPDTHQEHESESYYNTNSTTQSQRNDTHLSPHYNILPAPQTMNSMSNLHMVPQPVSSEFPHMSKYGAPNLSLVPPPSPIMNNQHNVPMYQSISPNYNYLSNSNYYQNSPQQMFQSHYGVPPQFQPNNYSMVNHQPYNNKPKSSKKRSNESEFDKLNRLNQKILKKKAKRNSQQQLTSITSVHNLPNQPFPMNSSNYHNQQYYQSHQQN